MSVDEAVLRGAVLRGPRIAGPEVEVRGVREFRQERNERVRPEEEVPRVRGHHEAEDECDPAYPDQA